MQFLKFQRMTHSRKFIFKDSREYSKINGRRKMVKRRDSKEEKTCNGIKLGCQVGLFISLLLISIMFFILEFCADDQEDMVEEEYRL